MLSENLETQELAHENELFSLQYDVYEPPKSYYIDTEGRAYLFEKILPSLNVTTDWIDDKHFKKSPH